MFFLNEFIGVYCHFQHIDIKQVISELIVLRAEETIRYHLVRILHCKVPDISKQLLLDSINGPQSWDESLSPTTHSSKNHS